MKTEEINTSFNDIINKSSIDFARTSSDMIKSVFDQSLRVEQTEVLKEAFNSELNFYVSIFFTGMVYGEYILAMNDETAALFLGMTLKGKQGQELVQIRQEISDSFCELLNMVVGKSVTSLNQIYKKLTITPPRVSFGSLSYPKVVMGKTKLSSDHGPVECYLYVDRMKLDIASSYKDALSSVLVAHNELQTAMKKLQMQQSILVQSEKMAALGTMAAGVAHEINSPLATVSLLGGIMKEILELEEEIDRPSFISKLDILDKTVLKISKITNSMREFAHGVRHEESSIVTVEQLIANAMLICEKNVKANGVDLQIDPSVQQISVQCLAPEMSQVLVHLINNAWFAAKELPEKWIKISAKETGDVVEFSVTDSGRGISENISKNIYDPFFTTKDIGSVGLGLSISKGIVDRHSGQLVLSNSTGNTCFVIRLPKAIKLTNAA